MRYIEVYFDSFEDMDLEQREGWPSRPHLTDILLSEPSLHLYELRTLI
jgi:hypothetical protein